MPNVIIIPCWVALLPQFDVCFSSSLPGPGSLWTHEVSLSSTLTCDVPTNLRDARKKILDLVYKHLFSVAFKKRPSSARQRKVSQNLVGPIWKDCWFNGLSDKEALGRGAISCQWFQIFILSGSNLPIIFCGRSWKAIYSFLTSSTHARSLTKSQGVSKWISWAHTQGK